MTPFTFAYRGVTFGEGTDILVEAEVDGLRSVSVASGSRPAPQFDGAIPGRHVVRPLNVVFPLRVFGRMGDGTLESRLGSVNAAFQPHPTTEFPLDVKLFEDEWVIYARPIKRREVVGPRSYSSGAVPYRVALERTDPFWYGPTVHSVSLPVYSLTGGGFDLPTDLPLDLGAATEETATAVNGGNADAYPLLRFQVAASAVGQVDGVTVTNETSGDDPLDLDVTVVAGQTLHVDMFAYVRATRGVDPIHIDGASRLSGWQHPRTPFRLVPGSNRLRLEVAGTVEPSALVTFRDTSL